ncbi:hypothetical protein, partial [Paenibacillus graminis]|uniref:hypothetical protein n=1 Tax=Paenibacillus graminis TaxID=189425 RepID=UPI0030C9CD8E
IANQAMCHLWNHKTYTNNRLVPRLIFDSIFGLFLKEKYRRSCRWTKYEVRLKPKERERIEQLLHVESTPTVIRRHCLLCFRMKIKVTLYVS